MNQETAQALFRDGAFLILQGVPEGTEFGIDWNCWNTGPKFEGVKMIPPGVHFVFYSAVAEGSNSTAPRTGFFHIFNSREILIKKWNNSNEELVDYLPTDEELCTIRDKLHDMDKNLGAYPYDTLKKWVAMSDNITSELVKKLSPEDGVVKSVLELLPEEVAVVGDENSRSLVTDKDGLPCMSANPASVIRFTPVAKHWYPDGASPAEVTKHSIDSSYILSTLLSTYQNYTDILGEMQFAFVCFILGQVFDAFEHWKKLVHVVCSCESELNAHLMLYKRLISVLYHQITEIPPDFFVDIVTHNNFLVSTLTQLFSNIQQSCFDDELQKKAKQFRKYLTKKYRWKFNEEPEDWAPVVVEM